MPSKPLTAHRSIVRRALISEDHAESRITTADGRVIIASNHAHRCMTMRSANVRYSACAVDPERLRRSTHVLPDLLLRSP
jgi:hypothetical protein